MGGASPSSDDKDAFDGVKGTPDSAKYPHTFAWWKFIAMFSPKVRASWGEAQPDQPAKGGKPKGGKKGGKKEEKKAEDDFDPFGDDGADEGDTKKKLEEAKKKAIGGKKSAPIAKSLIIFEVKPWESETPLDKMAADILKIEMDGLRWKTEYKLEPVAFGIRKLVIGCVVEDEKVSTDDLQEKIEALEDYVQSVDIAAFNKL